MQDPLYFIFKYASRLNNEVDSDEDEDGCVVRIKEGRSKVTALMLGSVN